MAPFKLGPFEVGLNTIWLGMHGMLMLIALMCLAFLIGAIWFSHRADGARVRDLRLASLALLGSLVVLTLTGLIPDVAFEKGAAFSGTFSNAFGTVQASVTDDNVSAFTGPLLFDIMEHVSLIVPALAALFCFLVWHFGRRVIEDAPVRLSALAVLAVTTFWIMAVGNIGLYVTKILTFPYTR